jgi:E3 ubiquitin-protein ligase ZSWIM2
MKVWSDHQKSNGEVQLKCPLCREIFSTFEKLDEEFKNSTSEIIKNTSSKSHYGFACSSCKCSPINGKCYKCTECKEFYLCLECFNTAIHRHHSFVYREVCFYFVSLLSSLNIILTNSSSFIFFLF